MGTVRHAENSPVPPFFLVFDSQDDVASLSLEYEIHAHNLPKRETGTVQVVIERGLKRSPLYPGQASTDPDDEGTPDDDDDEAEVT
jgi:hypothetical protein